MQCNALIPLTPTLSLRGREQVSFVGISSPIGEPFTDRRILLPLPEGEYVLSGPFPVAQNCILPYRRIAFCGPPRFQETIEGSDALPIAHRRYCRLQICATSNPYQGEGKTDSLLRG